MSMAQNADTKRALQHFRYLLRIKNKNSNELQRRFAAVANLRSGTHCAAVHQAGPSDLVAAADPAAQLSVRVAKFLIDR
jgi:hypothetical protein